MRQLLLSIILLSLRSACGNYIFAPQIIREGADQVIVVSLHGIPGRVTVVASLRLNGIVTFREPDVDATKPVLVHVKYQKPDGVPPTNRRQYVELIVTVNKENKNVFQNNLRMRLVENSGYLHVDTDRPIYRPNEIVNYRVTALNQNQLPEMDRKVIVDIRIPEENVGIKKTEYQMGNPDKFIEDTFGLPEFPVFGIWSVEARYEDQKVVKWSKREFEVRPYVLPTFNVRINLKKPFILVKDDMSDDFIEGTITAEYSYGKRISGSYYLVAKLKRPGFDAVIFYEYPAQLQEKAPFVNGKAEFRIKTTTVLLALGEDEGGFQALNEEGACVFLEASVTGEDTGTIESDRSPKLPFVDSPYVIKNDRMSKYYTPGTAFEIKVDVVNSVNQRPVQGVTVVLTGPTSCGNVKCNAGDCCQDNNCARCQEIVIDSDENGQVNTKVNMGSQPVTRTYNVRTRELDVDAKNAGSLTFTLYPYESKDKNKPRVLQLSASEKIATVPDNNFQIDVWYKDVPSELRYFIVSRGGIVATGSSVPRRGSIQHALRIGISSDMVPSFRIFVYYLIEGEMVSNSLWVQAQDACKKDITVTVPKEVLPGSKFKASYEGSSDAIVGLKAVDRAAYFLHGDSRLTRQSVFEGLNEYDEGCVREGGKNAQHVFEEGGFQVVGGDYPRKEDFSTSCNNRPGGRRKRSASEKGREQILKLQRELDMKKCEIDAKIKTNDDDDDCKTRADRVETEHGYDCSKKFFDACIKQKRQSLLARSSARSADGNAQARKKAIGTTRSNFEENMLWRTERMPPNGELILDLTAKDSITTFEFDTISMSPTDGFCVAETQNMTIFKKVFVQLKLPYSLKRMEQAEIRATVFNYDSDDKNIKVSLRLGEDMCSHFTPGRFSELATLRVPANSASGVNFVVLPLRIPRNGRAEIEVEARENNDIVDSIKRSILVEPEGEMREIKGTHTIDLKRQGVHDFNLTFRFPENYVPETRKCTLYPYSNFMGPIIEFDPVTRQPKNDIHKIIRMPGGCGEQTMLSMGPNVYAHSYLRSVGKMAPGSPEERGSISKMESGFANELKYRCNCNPKVWSVFPRHEPSVWLNAYVNKVFAQAKQFYTNMDVTPICTSVFWLTTQQNPDGSFQSRGRVIHKEMHGAVGSPLSLAAYVMMSLVESASVCPDSDTTKAVEEAIMKATAYLESQENHDQMNQPYALSLVAYAMTISDPNHPFAARMRQKLKDQISYSPDNRLAFWKGAPLAQIRGTGTHAYWYERKPLAIDIEATGYALMALVHHASVTGPNQATFDLTRKIVLWLIEQRDENGGFSTTQDTVVGLQALTNYMIWSAQAEPDNKEVDISLTIHSAPGTTIALEPDPIRIHLDASYENTTRPIQLGDDVVNSGWVHVAAQGVGEGTVSYRCIYRTLVEEEPCHFQFAINLKEEEDNALNEVFEGENALLKMTILVSKPDGQPSGQSIVEVNLISGYVPLEDSLQRLSRTFFLDGVIERYEIANQKVIMYLSEITEKPIVLAFLITKEVEIAAPEPATVTVYDYYEPSVRCSKFYSRPGGVPQLRTTPCKDDEEMCKCAEGGCLKCRTREEQLQKTHCLPDMKGKCRLCSKGSTCFNLTQIACKSNYVYLVNVTEEVQDTSGIFVRFKSKIKTLYKRGPDANAQPEVERDFVARTDCFQKCRDEALKSSDKKGEQNSDYVIQKYRQIVIFGSSFDESLDKDGNTVSQYNLKGGDHVENVYSSKECNDAAKYMKNNKKKCKKPKGKKQKASCKENSAVEQSCLNLKLLRRMLVRGCDSV